MLSQMHYVSGGSELEYKQRLLHRYLRVFQKAVMQTKEYTRAVGALTANMESR